MLGYAISGGFILTGIAAILFGIAAMRVADAWRIWAARCHPKNQSFRPEVFPRRGLSCPVRHIEADREKE